MTYRILDLFCGAGGAAKGYHDAGFEVIGVDINPQPNYPYEFCKGDAMEWLKDIAAPHGDCSLNAIHASPPCQGYSVLAVWHPEISYPKLVEPLRELLQETGLPYVIENVEGAPLIDPVMLCATMFPDTRIAFNGRTYQLRRHRLFETNWPLEKPRWRCYHQYRSFPVYGHGYPGHSRWFQGAPMAKMAREVMHTPWMSRDEFCEAIPPYYTGYVGRQLTGYLDSASNREAA